MRLSKGILVLVVVAFLLGVSAVAFAAPPTGWPVNRGEICLQVYEDDGGTPTGDPVGEVSMYVTKMGDGHYLVLGRNIEQDDTVPFIGAAEFVDVSEDGISVTKVKIHITGSGVMPTIGTDPGDVHGNMSTVILNPASLIGTVESLDMMALKTTKDRSDADKAITPDEYFYHYGVDYDIKRSGIKHLYPCGTEPETSE